MQFSPHFSTSSKDSMSLFFSFYPYTIVFLLGAGLCLLPILQWNLTIRKIVKPNATTSNLLSLQALAFKPLLTIYFPLCKIRIRIGKKPSSWIFAVKCDHVTNSELSYCSYLHGSKFQSIVESSFFPNTYNCFNNTLCFLTF